MFKPPFCPHRSCSQHLHPDPGFYRRHGHYYPLCRAHPVPRFLCLSCRRTFSRQTFRMDYRDHRPDLNARLLEFISMGVGIRMSSRRLGLTLRCTELKLRKIARHLRRLNLNLRHPLSGAVELQFDELETFESNRSLRPLTIPVLIERESRYCIWAESATIRPRGKMTKKRIERLRIEDWRHGARKDRSRRSIRRTMNRGREMLSDEAVVTLFTDEKSTYPRLAREAFGRLLAQHKKTNSKLARTTGNPLFPINHEDARMRDMMSRLRKRSWLVSKKRRYLELCLQVQMAYRNLVQTRYNFDDQSPAEILGFVHRRLSKGEALSWCQRFGERSLHPLSTRALTVERYREGLMRAA